MLSRVTTVCLTAALLNGCGAPHSLAANPATPALRASHGTSSSSARSWMLAEAASDDLLYAADWYNGDVYVLSYPQGKLVGTLSGFSSPGSMCVDSAGDVWIPTYAGIFEYAHGGTTPIATLQEGQDAEPDACSIDPTSGDLATANRFPVAVAIFKNASGNPTFYQLDGFQDWASCAYDPSGNLFAASFSTYDAIAELPRGGYALIAIALNSRIHPAYSMQWDGEYLAIRSADPHGEGHPVQIARVEVTGSKGKVKSTVDLADRVGRSGPFPGQYFVFGKRIVGPDRYRGAKRGPHAYSLDFWRYPGGGRPVRVLGHVGEIWGTVISPAVQRLR